MNAKTFAALVEECFEDALTRKRLAASSHKVYRWRCRVFATWIDDRNVTEADRDRRVEGARPEYLNLLEKPKAEGGKGYMPRHLYGTNQAILFFYRWMVQQKHLTAVPDEKDQVNLPEIKKPRRPFTKPWMAKAMIEATSKVEDPYRSTLLKAMITMMHDIPLRKMEQLSLELRDVNLETGEVHVRHGKGDKERFNYLSNDGIAAVREYLAARHKSALPNLWLHSPGQHVGEDWLYDQITALAVAAGISDRDAVLPHAARRGTARRYREAGMDLVQIQHMLGHASLEQTLEYIESDDDELAKNRNVARLFADPPEPTPTPEPVPAPEPAIPTPKLTPYHITPPAVFPLRPRNGTRPRALRRPIC